MLKNEEKSDTAEFHVKEVQYIQAKAFVGEDNKRPRAKHRGRNILEEVGHLIDQNHLFERSIILIKAWCMYCESCILGAHHVLISTYALETLVPYIFILLLGLMRFFNRILEFFSNCDWDNFCLSLWGPIPFTASQI